MRRMISKLQFVDLRAVDDSVHSLLFSSDVNTLISFFLTNQSHMKLFSFPLVNVTLSLSHTQVRALVYIDWMNFYVPLSLL